jgi:diguanylate cyclase (GGDEF)-like protein
VVDSADAAVGPSRVTGPAEQDRLVRFCAVLAAVAAGWFAVYAVHPIGPAVLLWLPAPICAPVVARVYWLAAASPGTPTAVRDFWRRLAPVALTVGAAHVAQAADASFHPGRPPDPGSLTTLSIYAVATALMIYALLRVPGTRREHDAGLRITLDASTVVLATAVLIWHFGTRRMLDASPEIALLANVLSVLTLFGVFALARVMLSDFRVVDARGLRLIGAAMFVGAFAPLAQPLVSAIGADLYVQQVSIPLIFLLSARAGALQSRVVPGARRTSGRGTRPFSLMPYTAVAIVDGLLLWVTFTDGDDLPVVAAAAVTLTALVVLRQISALRDNGRLLAQLDHGATHDALTGLANRVLFRRRLEQALRSGDNAPVAVILVDLDDFKQVNDTLGHEVGDLLLVEVAARLARCVGAGDTVARLGGDEFVMALHDADPPSADVVAERIVDALRRPVHAGGHALGIRASAGIADGRAGDDASLLLRRADIAMYAAKSAGRGTPYLHYPEGMVAGCDPAALMAELRAAIAADQLFLLYQPIVDLADGRIVAAEALVRWAHPLRGVLTPDVFLPAAERSGLTLALARWVLGTAFRHQVDWPAPPGRAVPPTLHVNVSARDLREPQLARDVAGLLAAHGADARRVTIEVTESTALDGAQALATLHDLRELGLRVSLDDFGTGHSTLSLLHDCPVDEIKLDRSFTQAAHTPGGDRVSMAAAVVHLARVLGKHVVAEGVETREQAEQLVALGYTAAQGYWFAEPVAAEAFAGLLTAGVQDKDLCETVKSQSVADSGIR